MGVAIAVLGGFAALAVILLCVPVELRFRLEAEDRFTAQGSLVWLFGLVRRDLRGRGEAAGRPVRRRPSKEPKMRPKNRQRSARRMLRIVRTPGLTARALRAVHCVVRSIRWRHLRADLRIGLEDPADTGDLFALIGPATIALWGASRGRISVQPVFAGEAVLRGRAAGRLRVTPVRPLACALGFVLSKPVIRAAWRARRSR